MKAYPWMKFSPDEWLLGNIQFCSDAAQLLFINTCALYWRNNCSLTVVQLKKKSRLRSLKFNKTLQELIDENILCTKNDDICIKFLDEQHAQRIARTEVNKENGYLGGKANAIEKSSEKEANAKHIRERKEIENKNKDSEGEQDETDIGSHPQGPISIESSTEWHAIKCQAWCKALKTQGAKIGAGSWENWQRIVNTHTLEIVLKVLATVEAGNRWPDAVETNIIAYKAALDVSAINGGETGFFG